MFKKVRKALDKQELQIQWSSWAPVDDMPYALHNVLIPEVLLKLVMEDMGLDYEEAIEVVEESREFGEAGFTRFQMS
ncbi:hypothetical protein FRC12_011253 [Ceratobasidium sp. 428]|nr:hypothetical protein FRC12_011253 [Ceratobasidium sp. 428]